MKRLLLSAVTALSIGSAVAQSNFFDKTCYRGAFAPAPTNMWTNTWTEWDPQNKVYGAPTVTVSTDITTNTTWSTGQVVLLTAPIYVTQNSILTIQPGVIILGKKASGAAVIITQGSKLIANGTAAQPIVFTSDQAPGLRGLGDWGGVILLGKASNNNSGGTNNIEGLPISNNTLYGGGANPDDNDNSGSLKYIRIEYCGIQYQPNQEINGLTFGAVGRGTTIDYIQVSYSNDDAFEWFGGTVNCKHLVSYRCLDDDFDTDNGFGGKVQYGLAVRDPQIADNPSVSTSEFFESDNDASGTSASPQTNAIFSNITCIGPLRGVLTATTASGHRSRARIRRNSALRIYNSIMMDQATRGMFIDGSAAENNALNNNLKFKNNIVAGYGQRATESGTFNIITANTFIIANANDTLKSSANILTTPYNYTSPDYRPSAGSIALSNASFTDAVLAAVTNPSVVTVTSSYAGAICIGNGTAVTAPAMFGPITTIPADYCSLMWTVSPGIAISSTVDPNPTFTISTIGTFTSSLMVTTANGVVTVTNAITTYTCDNVGIKESTGKIGTVSLYPNPSTNDLVTLRIDASSTSPLEVAIYDLTGKLVSAPIQNLDVATGENNFKISTFDMNNGVYFVTLKTVFGKETVKLIVNK